MMGVKWVTEKEEMVGLFIGLSWAKDFCSQDVHKRWWMENTWSEERSLSPQHSYSQEAEAVGSLLVLGQPMLYCKTVSQKTNQKDDGKCSYHFSRGKEDSVYS